MKSQRDKFINQGSVVLPPFNNSMNRINIDRRSVGVVDTKEKCTENRSINSILGHEESMLPSDIYYQKEYVKLYLKENEQLFEFSFKENGYWFYQISIKRKITKIGTQILNKSFYDLKTAYGYGGVFCNTANVSFLSKAIKAYKQECAKQSIIAEFSTIHPFNRFCERKANFYDFLEVDRQLVVVDTSLKKEERWSHYSPRNRSKIRKSQRELTIEKSVDIDTFVELYIQTMDKNKAADFYYFDRKYFENLLKIDGVELYFAKFNDIVISASIFMFSKDYVHYHLSANNLKYKNYNGNYLLLDFIFDLAIERKIKKVLLGGGRTNRADDLLLKFKKIFSKKTKNFYIAGNIYNQPVFDEYVDIWRKQKITDRPFFLKYRLTENLSALSGKENTIS